MVFSELDAYRRFGERCSQVQYKIFSTLLIQNLQKGSRQLSDMLERESLAAWGRNESARPGFWGSSCDKAFVSYGADAFGGHGDHYDSGISLILWRNLNTKKQLGTGGTG